MIRQLATVLALLLVAGSAPAWAQTAVSGIVRDETGFALPGVGVELSDAAQRDAARTFSTTTDSTGAYRFERVQAGQYDLSFALVNFATVRRRLVVRAAGAAPRLDVVMHLSLSADVTVTGKRTFTNLADAERPAEDLVGIAASASQGAITARQLDARPMMRTGEVMETVPGVVISQHSGEGKANQYFLRGFNLDHGTDFATTIAGMPVNLPSHGHGQGYSDLNFLIPELVAGVQFSKGPYFAEQGDFATAGAANVNYVSALDRPIVRVGGGDEGFARALVAVSPSIGGGRLLAALDVQHDDGPWVNPDRFRKISGLVRYSRGDALNGVSITGMAYHGRWQSTDQVPARAIASGLIGRFGALDASDGGESARYSGSIEWQHTRDNAVTKLTAYGIRSDLDLFSNFTYFLDDPVHGDQIQQTDHRFISGAKASYRRLSRWSGRQVQSSIGAELRNDDIMAVGLFHTEQRQRVSTVRDDAILQTSAAAFAQNETAWTPWLRTIAGARVDGYRFHVGASNAVNSGTTFAGIVSPKGGAIVGPWRGTELYVNAGLGFHSNDARGTTIARDPSSGEPVSRVTPLARASGSEVGMRSVIVPHLQTTLTIWTLHLDSELVFAGDTGTTNAGRPSRRYGVEWASYYSPLRWLTIDADVSRSRARFTDVDPGGSVVPGSLERVVSGGVTVDSVRRVFGSARWRYFGPRPLAEDNAVRSRATSLVNLEAGYKLSPRVRVGLDVFNLLNAADSDIDYYYVSRLRGEPAGGVADVHLHPTLPRTARLNLILAF